MLWAVCCYSKDQYGEMVSHPGANTHTLPPVGWSQLTEQLSLWQ